MSKNIVEVLRKIIEEENNTRKNYGLQRTRNGVEIYYLPNSNMETYLIGKRIGNNIFYIEQGATNNKFRNKGIGKQMRALMTLAAKRAGFKTVLQTSVFMNRNQKKTHKNPPSSYVMKSLGFNEISRHYNNNGRVNEIKHRYNFNKKLNNNRLTRAAFPLRTHPLSRARTKT